MLDDGFPRRVKESLRRAVGGYCSAPFCGIQTVVYDPAYGKDKLTGDAAHICGARPGAARYSDLPFGADRNGYDNGIWLCAVCHRMIDHSESLYPKGMLHQWKQLAINAHQEGGRRRSAHPVGADLRSDHQSVSEFIAEVWGVRAIFLKAKFYVPAQDRFRSRIPLDREIGRLLRNRAGLFMAKPWNAYHPHWTFTPDFKVWQDEVVRLATRLAELPSLSLSSDYVFDLYHRVDEDGSLVFQDETTRALYGFIKFLERFEDFVRTYRGPQSNIGHSFY